MLKLIIHDDEGHKTVVPFVREEITIGRQEGNTIRLTERNVSRRHARLLRTQGQVTVEDLGSYNGIRVNGEKIAGQTAVHAGDLIQIGDYDLSIESAPVSEAPPPPQPPQTTTRELALATVEDATADAVPASGETPIETQTEVTAPVVSQAEAPAPTPAAAPAPVPWPAQPVDPARRDTAVIRRDVAESRKREIRDVDLKSAPRLVIISSELKGTEFACVRTELRIGRTDENDIPIDHRSLSRTHAKIMREDDGQWRILDMQSANGLTVNGETYSDVVLKSGDVIELGHVKLRFVLGGEKTRGSGRGLLLGGTAVVLIGAALGALLVTGTVVLPPPMQAWLQKLHPSALTQLVTGTATPAAAKKAPAAAAPVLIPEEELERRIREAEAAMATRTYDRAVVLLERLPEPRTAQVLDLLEQARIQAGFQSQLAQIEASIEAGELDAAETQLAAFAPNADFATEHSALVERLSKARAKASAEAAARAAQERAEKAAEAKAAQAEARAQARLEKQARKEAARAAVADAETAKTEPVKAVAPAEEPDRQAQLDALFNTARESFLAKNYRQSEQTLRRCVAFDETYAPCHMLLGSTYARLQQLESGLRHYKRFLALDPQSPQAPQVRKLIADYEATQR